jgi:ABC-type Zn2+ transport system substrate-binding protein/surface adhesin
MDPIQALAMANRVKLELMEMFPGRSALFERNYRDFTVEIQNLDTRMRLLLDPLRGLKLVYHHDSLYHLEQRYGLSSVAVLLPGHETQGGVRTTYQVAQMLRAGSVDCVLTEPGIPQGILKSLKVSEYTQTIVFDPLVGRPGATPARYSELILGVVTAMRACLPGLAAAGG